MTSKLSPKQQALHCLVVDASVAINLLGTGQPATILQVMKRRVVIEEWAAKEVLRDPSTGMDADAILSELQNEGLLSVERMSSSAFEAFLELTGPAQGLDDGEAATIAHSLSIGATPVLDERKGRRVSMARGQRPLYTIELLRLDGVEIGLGPKLLSDLLFASIVNANMHLPVEHLDWAAEQLGNDRVNACSWLSKLIAKRTCP